MSTKTSLFCQIMPEKNQVKNFDPSKKLVFNSDNDAKWCDLRTHRQTQPFIVKDNRTFIHDSP